MIIKWIGRGYLRYEVHPIRIVGISHYDVITMICMDSTDLRDMTKRSARPRDKQWMIAVMHMSRCVSAVSIRRFWIICAGFQKNGILRENIREFSDY